MIRIIKAIGYSLEGLWAAFKHETAFRQECIAFALICPAAFWVASSPMETLMIIGGWVLVMVVELINSGLEILCDEISMQRLPSLKKIKDYGSAAVMLIILLNLSLWSVLIVSYMRSIL